jgi:hypothetical protein
MKKGSPRDYELVGYVPSVNGFTLSRKLSRLTTNLSPVLSTCFFDRRLRKVSSPLKGSTRL